MSLSSKRKWMLGEGCEFKSRTLELEEITGHSRLMRRRVLLRAHFLDFQDDKDLNYHRASPVMPPSRMSSELALTSCLDSSLTTACPGPRTHFLSHRFFITSAIWEDPIEKGRIHIWTKQLPRTMVCSRDTVQSLLLPLRYVQGIPRETSS